VLWLLSLDIFMTTPARSANVAHADKPANSPPSSSRAELTPSERLQRLVPEQIGAWKRHSLGGALPGRAALAEPADVVDAEFRNGNRRATLSVSDAGAGAAKPYQGAPTRTATDDGPEAIYHEEGATVLEKVRRIDGRAEVTLLRDDGIVIVAVATGVTPIQLKRLARGIKARSAMTTGR
jgi:hypothetical protein